MIHVGFYFAIGQSGTKPAKTGRVKRSDFLSETVKPGVGMRFFLGGGDDSVVSAVNRFSFQYASKFVSILKNGSKGNTRDCKVQISLITVSVLDPFLSNYSNYYYS